MWCPSCRDEFRAGFDRCAECDVALVDVMPPPPQPLLPPTPGPALPVDHVVLEYDVADWSDDQRAALALHLQLAAIPAEWDLDGLLVVGRSWQREVDELVELIDGEGPGAQEEWLAVEPADEPEWRLASPGRRLLGFFVDYLFFSPLAWSIQRAVEPGATRMVVLAALGIAYWAAPEARWGRTIGKLAVGTRVQRVDGVIPPGWVVALIRWGVVVLPGYLLIPFGVVGSWLEIVWSIVVYAPILGPSRQGIHDRLAKTIVVRVSRDGS